MARSLADVLAIPELRQRARALGKLLAERQTELADLSHARRQVVTELRAAGATQAEVAEVLGVTQGRVSQVESGADQRRPAVVVERSLPTEPTIRASASLYLTEAEQQGVVPRREMLYVGTEPCPAHIAPRMATAPGEPVFARRKRMFADDVPVRIATSFFPVALAEGSVLTDQEFVAGGLQVALEAMGRHFGRSLETMVARRPTDTETALLDLDEGDAVVQIVRSSYDTDDAPVHTLETICAASRHVFHIRPGERGDVF